METWSSLPSLLMIMWRAGFSPALICVCDAQKQDKIEFSALETSSFHLTDIKNMSGTMKSAEVEQINLLLPMIVE